MTTETSAVPYLEMNDGHSIPQLGFGVFQVPPEDTAEAESHAQATGVVPAVTQVELHPRFPQTELRRFHSEQGFLTEAWSPLAQAQVLDEPAVREIAERHGRSPAQVILRWHIQLRNVVIPKSVAPARIEENFRLFDFELTTDDMRAIDRLDRGQRIGPDPAQFSMA